MTARFGLPLIVLLVATGVLSAADLVVELPQELTPSSAVATDRPGKQEFAGVVAGQSARFKDVPPAAPVDVKITTSQGPVLQGFNTAWYAEYDAPAEPPGPLSDDDIKEITSIVRDIPSFYSKSDLLHLSGDHARAVALVQLLRDTLFHGDTGGEIIWRVELWYFEFQAGGWAKVGQSNKVLRRERFKDKKAFDADAGKIRWVSELGGIAVKENAEQLKIIIQSANVQPKTSAK